MLKGVKQKWTDAGEGELLYKWVSNSKTLIEGGSSKMAAAAKDFSPTEMPPQQATEAEIDQILDYVDNYVAPAAATPTTTGETTPAEVESVPNYKENLNIFYALLLITIVLILAILLLTGSIMSFIKSEVFKNKTNGKKDNDDNDSNLGKILTLFVIGISLMVPMDTFALNYMTPGEAEGNSLWLIVENSDIFALLVIDFLLLLVVLYLKRLFNSFYYMVYTRKEKVVKTKNKVANVFTDAVPIEEEDSILMDHEYDGIRELDNNLPPWWVWGFYLTIIFSFIYIFHYHFFRTGDLQTAEYDKSVATAQKEINEYLKSQAMNIDESNVTLMTEAAALGEGKTIFTTNCAVCHKEGQGDIGPNLTDKFWIYGNDIKDVFKTIKNGTPNGMPDHASKLNPIQLQQVSSYILSLKFKPGKEPQGKEYK
jgi:cytochrome c oxidase cbb3-type subunit 3